MMVAGWPKRGLSTQGSAPALAAALWFFASARAE